MNTSKLVAELAVLAGQLPCGSSARINGKPSRLKLG